MTDGQRCWVLAGFLFLLISACGSRSTEPEVTGPVGADADVVSDVAAAYLAQTYASLSGNFQTGYALVSTECTPALSLERYTESNRRLNDFFTLMTGVDPSTVRFESIEVQSVDGDSATVKGVFETELDDGTGLVPPEEPETFLLEDGQWKSQTACGLVFLRIPEIGPELLPE